MSPTIPPTTPGRDRPSPQRSPRGTQPSGWSCPKLIGIGVDGHPSGRDATVLGSLLGRAAAAELMLIAVHEEPLLPVALPGGMSWTALEKQARAALVEARDSLAPDARIMVQADALVWRGLCHTARREHRDLLVVGSAQKAQAGRVQLGRSVGELLGHLECPLAVAPAGFGHRTTTKIDRIGVGFDATPESQSALELAVSIACVAGAALEVRSAIDDGVAGGLKTEQIMLAGNALTERRLAEAFQRGRAATYDTGVPTNLEVEVGMPTDVLSELCDEVDLLVLGSGYSGPPGRVQPGSTGQGMLGLATCPVLVVPRPRSA
jgi:nucleotide-binding universal stress UspA family protein